MAKGIVSNRGGIQIAAGGATVYQDEVIGQSGLTITFTQTYAYGATGVLFYRNGILMDKVNSFTIGGTTNAEEYQEVNNGPNSTQITLNSTNPATSDELFQLMFFEGTQSGGGGGGTTVDVLQNAHGFVALDAVYHDGISWVKAQADDAETLAQYLVVEVQDINNFTAASFGKFEIIAHGKTPGEFYFLSESVAGGSSIAEATVYSAPLFYVEDANNIHAFVYRPSMRPQLTQFREDVDILENILDFDLTSSGFSLETSINGESFRLTHDASSVVYAEKDIAITPKFRDKILQLSTDISSTALSGNFKVIITDLTNSKILADEILTPQTITETVKRVVSFSTAPAFGDDPIENIKVRYEGLVQVAAPVSNFDDIVISLLKTQAIEEIAISQEENTFSARIANNGTASILSEGPRFIQSVSRISPGAVDITWIPGFFTAIPCVTASPNGVLGTDIDKTIVVLGVTTLGCRILTEDTVSASAVDLSFTLIAQRQDSDYRNLERRVDREISTFKEVIVEQEDSMIRLHTANGYGSIANKIRRFNTVVSNIGSAITYADSATNGSSFTINEDGVYDITFTDSEVADEEYVGLSLNASSLTTGIETVTYPTRLSMVRISGSIGGVSWSGFLQAGDVVRPHTNGSAASTSSHAQFTIAKQGSLKKAVVAPDSKIEIPSSELRFEGASTRGATDTGIVRFDTIAKLRGDAFTVQSDVNVGTKITITKSGKLDVNASLILTTASTAMAISRNQTVLTSIPSISSESLSTDQAFSGNTVVNCSWSGSVAAGDIIRVAAQGNPGSHVLNNLHLIFQEQDIQVAISNITPQYEDVDSSIRVDGSNGYGSTNTRIKRFSNIRENIGTDITYADSPTLGASFTINTDGIYSISYSDQGTVAMYFGPTKNSTELTTNIGSLAVPSSRLAMGTTSNVSGYPDSVSWQGSLVAGDIIRAHTDGTTSGTADRTTFTISKVGKPSITEVDVTPFADINRLQRQYFEHLLDVSTFGSTSTLYPILSSPSKRDGNDVFTVSSTSTGGTQFIMLKDGPITLAGTATFNSTSQGFGIFRNDIIVARTFDNSSASPREAISRTFYGKTGDVFAIGRTSGVNPLTVETVSVYAEADSRSTMYSVAQTENEFSAKIQNNGAASVLSESSPFIQSVSRTGLGVVTVTFVPGFFSQPPAVTATSNILNANMISVASVTTSGFTTETNLHDGTKQDRDFYINVSRQESDRKDLQKAIVNLNEFPRVNKTISQQITHTALANTLLDRFSEARFVLSNLINTGDGILTIEDDLANTRTKFIATRKCIVDVSLTGPNATAGYAASVYKNGTVVMGGNTLGSGAGQQHTVSAQLLLSAGDFITVGMAGDSFFNNTDPVRLSIVAEAQDLEVITNLDAVQNEYTMRVTSAGTVINSDFTDGLITITNPATGRYVINYSALGLSHIPVVEAQVYRTGAGTNFNTFGSVSDSPAPTLTTCEVRTGFSTAGQTFATVANYDFTFRLSKVEGDYKDVQDIVAQVFTPKVAYVKDVAASGINRSSVAAVWNQRILNTVEGDSDIVSLTSNRFTIQAGKYLIKTRAQIVQTNQSHTRLVMDPAGSPVYYYGEPKYVGSTDSVDGYVETKDNITIAQPATFELQHYTTLGGVNKLGANAGLGVNQVFATVEIAKIY